VFEDFSESSNTLFCGLLSDIKTWDFSQFWEIIETAFKNAGSCVFENLVLCWDI